MRQRYRWPTLAVQAAVRVLPAGPCGADELGVALQGGRLVGRWRALQHITASPSRIGDIAKAALVLTQFEHGYLPP
jgi:hypothetical protein